jgi:hypothetical protein
MAENFLANSGQDLTSTVSDQTWCWIRDVTGCLLRRHLNLFWNSDNGMLARTG